MPEYFFHLLFELYPQPLQLGECSTALSDSEIYLPPRNANIFDRLPAHKAPCLSSPDAGGSHKRSKTSTQVDNSRINTIAPDRPLAVRRYSHLSGRSPGDPKQSPVPLSSKRAPEPASPQPVSADWRFDRISIQSIDMKSAEEAKEEVGVRLKGKSFTSTVRSTPGGLATKGKFIPAGPTNTEVGWGVVHLYRDVQPSPSLCDESIQGPGLTRGKSAGGGDGGPFNEDECDTLCILAVPSYMTPSDFLGYVGEQTREDVSHFRLIRTGRANKYMVLMKFREPKKAKAWRKEWNGKLFNSMEPENCHVVYVKSVQFQTPESSQDPSSFPNMTNDPFAPAPRPAPPALVPATSPPPIESLMTKPLAPPTPSLVELPTCPVCLERMDESTGLLTILCQHVFHCACLEKWRGSGCPVCRYTQNDPRSGRGALRDLEQENVCSVCGSTSNLWICLICGNIGCGRYDSAHAFAHWEATSHAYAMDVSTQHVWDYAGDGYVHRLIQNKADGKLVDLPAAYRGNFDGGRRSAFGDAGNGQWVAYGEDMVPREKLDNMGIEYAYLLTSQLESQRSYFEEQMDRAADKAAKAASVADEAMRSVTEMSTQMKELQIKYEEATRNIASLEKDVQRQTARATSSADLARKLTRNYQEEKTMNEALMQRIRHLEKQAEEKDRQVLELELAKRELEEQNRDLSFFISGGEKLRELQEGGEVAGEEVTEGKVEIPPAAEGKKGKRKGKGKK